MTGSDWPVCNLASDYSGAIDLVRTCISEYNGYYRDCIMRNSAVSAYNLDLS
jgi:predicted TIM-barrel fold metal-dependent hydrolase